MIVAVVLAAVITPAASGASEPQLLQFHVIQAGTERAAAEAVLSSYLRKIDGRLTVRRCNLLVVSRPGRSETIYGGACRLSTGADVIVCGDTGIGEFAASLGATSSPELVQTFTMRNCPGG